MTTDSQLAREIWVLTDGKAGMVAQASGLAERVGELELGDAVHGDLPQMLPPKMSLLYGVKITLVKICF